MQHTTCFLIGSGYHCVFQPAHIGVFEKRFAAIIQRVSMFEYFRYDTNGQILLLEKLNLKESFFFSQ